MTELVITLINSKQFSMLFASSLRGLVVADKRGLLTVITVVSNERPRNTEHMLFAISLRGLVVADNDIERGLLTVITVVSNERPRDTEHSGIQREAS